MNCKSKMVNHCSIFDIQNKIFSEKTDYSTIFVIELNSYFY